MTVTLCHRQVDMTTTSDTHRDLQLLTVVIEDVRELVICHPAFTHWSGFLFASHSRSVSVEICLLSRLVHKGSFLGNARFL